VRRGSPRAFHLERKKILTFREISSFVRSARLLRRYPSLDSYIHEISGFISIENTRPEDVFIVGYPKSGHTWMQYLLTGVVYGLNAEYTPSTLLQSLVPDVHACRYYRRYVEPMYFKSHFLPRPEYRRVIYLLRDGRDVMVSYFHHLSAYVPDGEIDFAEMVCTGRSFFPCKWHEHVTTWRSNPYKAQMMILKYEDLQSATVQQLLRMCEFLSISRPISLLESVVEMSSFARLREREERFGRGEPGRCKDKFFFRRGTVGSYKDEMPEPVLDLFLAEAAPALQACGYLR